MKDILENKLLLVVLVLGLVLGAVIVGGKVVIDKVTTKVIQKLQKDYSPGPYAPGFDPDRVNPNFWRQQQQQPPQQQFPPNQVPPNSQFPPNTPLPTPVDWRTDWENQRR
jgi:hypothetical protein